MPVTDQKDDPTHASFMDLMTKKSLDLPDLKEIVRVCNLDLTLNQRVQLMHHVIDVQSDNLKSSLHELINDPHSLSDPKLPYANMREAIEAGKQEDKIYAAIAYDRWDIVEAKLGKGVSDSFKALPESVLSGIKQAGANVATSKSLIDVHKMQFMIENSYEGEALPANYLKNTPKASSNPQAPNKPLAER